MMRTTVSVLALAALTACGDPLADIEDLSEVTLAETPTRSALPTEDPDAPQESLFARLWGQPEDSQVPDEAADVAEAAEAETVAPDVEDLAVSEAAPDAEAVEEVQVASIAPDALEEPAPRRGSVLGWLTRQVPKPAPQAEEVAEAETEALPTPESPQTAPEPQEAPVELASLEPEVLPDAEEAPARAEPEARREPQRRGLFGGRPARSEARAEDPGVPYGTVLPFGQVARVCEARSKPLGTRVETSGGRGQAYTLYDSQAGATTPRTFYITGFADKCPRQFTAALALFGDPTMHEQLRYGRPAEKYPYSDTDKAYETIKSRICKVGRGKPCGPRMDSLERTTVFVSTYERFTDNGRWADLLIHDGAVVASAIKAP